MNITAQLSDNLLLRHSITALRDTQHNILKVSFFFTFYGQLFEAKVSRRNVERDWAGIEADGPSELFESFVDQVEDNYWEEMKEFFHKHVEFEENNPDE